MPPKLTVSQNVIDRLSNVKQSCIGSLYGILYKNALLIIGFHIHDNQKSEIIHGFPTEIDMYGILEVGEGIIKEDEVKQLIRDVDVTDTPLYLSCKIEKSGNEVQAYFNVNNRLEETTFEIISEHDIYSQFVHIRLMTQLPLVCGTTVESIRESFLSLRKQLVHGQVVFSFPKTNIYMMGNDNENALIGVTGDPTVGEICKESTIVVEGCTPSHKKKKGRSLEVSVLRVIMFKKVTREPTLDNVKIHAPVVHIDKKLHESLILTINIDALSMVHRDEKIVELYTMLVESCCRYLRLLESRVVSNLEDCDGNFSKFSEPETFHFFPEICGHFITATYAKNDSEEALEKRRLLLHKRLLLPLNQPHFRRANRFVFRGDVQGSGLLVNPHEGITPSEIGGEVAIVRGKYSYYHYCQNNMDDNGWGCAYRSLQTLASWFLWQGYTAKEVPTFKEIQKCLVDIGDKPSNFVSSKQWIGSTEVNFVLNTLLNVTSKILYVSSGEEMGTKGPELINHFKTCGSPVMIGGGVLAHTILGVAYNNVTGIIKFLILDPHYTGSEDLEVIQKKGWCGWKGADFWDKAAYYNMCLPQVPECI